MSRLFYASTRTYSRLSNVPDGGLAFCVSNKFFVHFDSFEAFEPWYLGLECSMRTLSEVIRSDMRKLVLDIDSPDGATLDRLLMYDFGRHTVSRVHDVFFQLDIGKPNVVLYSMCSDDKMSYHAVVSNFAFSAQTCLGLCSIISSGQPWERCVDMGVYKAVQFVRVEMSTKPGERRWKVRLEEGPLRQGVLSDMAGTLVPGFVAAVYCRRAYPMPSCAVPCLWDQFRVGRSRSSNVLPLYRTKPGLCTQCNRVHDRENAFMRFTAEGPVFTCWRYYHAHKS